MKCQEGKQHFWRLFPPDARGNSSFEASPIDSSKSSLIAKAVNVSSDVQETCSNVEALILNSDGYYSTPISPVGDVACKINSSDSFLQTGALDEQNIVISHPISSQVIDDKESEASSIRRLENNVNNADAFPKISLYAGRGKCTQDTESELMTQVHLLRYSCNLIPGFYYYRVFQKLL